MKHKNKYLYFILLLMKEMTSVLLSDTSLLRYDITKAFDRWFSKVMNFNTKSATKGVLRALQEAEKYHLQEFEYNLEHEVEPFGKKFIFRDVVYGMAGLSPYSQPSFSEIDWNLRTNEISVLATQHGSIDVSIHINGHLSKDDSDDLFKVSLDFRNFRLRIAAHPNISKSVDISYDHFYAYYFQATGANWWNNYTLRFIAKNRLVPELKPAFIAMQKEIINRHNTLFQSVFESLFSISKQANHYASSTKADIFQKGRKYYYLIPNFPFFCGFSLKTIVIKGLTNIKSLKFYRDPSPFSHTFLMDNVQGSMVLDYERVEEKPLKLELKCDRFSMSIVHANNCVIVEAPEFSVNSTSGPLTRLQLTVLVPYIKSAIVSSVMPSRQVCDVPEDANVLVLAAIKQRITKASDWNMVKEICQDCIPFRKIQ